MVENPGNGQLAPFINDAIEKGIDVSTKSKAIIYLTGLNVFDPDVEASLLFLVKYLDSKAYDELYAYIKNLMKGEKNEN